MGNKMRIISLLNRLTNAEAISAERASHLAKKYLADGNAVDLVSGIYEEFNGEKMDVIGDVAQEIMKEEETKCTN